MVEGVGTVKFRRHVRGPSPTALWWRDCPLGRQIDALVSDEEDAMDSWLSGIVSRHCEKPPQEGFYA